MIHLLLAVIYVSFISLGLPDSLLGAAWPSIYQGFGVPVSYSGVIFCIISVGTVLSSLQSDRMTRRFGAGGVTAIRPPLHCSGSPSAAHSGRCACGRSPMDLGPEAWMRHSTTMWRSILPAAT